MTTAALAARRCPPLLLAASILWCGPPAFAAEIDPLDLQSSPAAEQATPESPLRLGFELAAGQIGRRTEPRTENAHRATIDIRWSARLGEQWRASVSDRLDYVSPAPQGQERTINALREAFASWQDPAGTTSIDFGRANVRQGPAFGFNPTDYFRIGALRSITTADPVALREIRMGTVMIRASHLWTGGGLSLAVAPKLANGPARSGESIDVGATNSAHRALVSVDGKASDRVNGQASVLLQKGTAPRLGFNATALVTGSLVAFGEASYGRQSKVRDLVLAKAADETRAGQAAVGLTYTLPSALAVTLEAEFNGAGLNRDEWRAVLAGGSAAYRRYVELTQPSQELGSRRAWLVYLSQKGVFLKDLDLTGFLRTNAVDQSRLAWLEVRYHWQRFDLALQLQRSWGDEATEFRVLPYSRVVQLVARMYL